MNETYYYGQGRVYLARRDDNGRPGTWYWVGDVSSLAVTLVFEQKISKSSRGGRLVNTRRYLTSQSGTVASRWHNFSSENLSLLLNSEAFNHSPSIIENEVLPPNINEGDRVSLSYQNVWGVDIPGLDEGRDYSVDALWGVINFITTPINQPLSINYFHAHSTSIPIFTDRPDEFAFRYESINLAESNKCMLVELYRLSFDPLTTLELINNDSALAGIDTAAEIMYDLSRPNDMKLGQFGRVVIIEKLSGITHNGFISHNGQFTHGGN